jgi:hypothetical protein
MLESGAAAYFQMPIRQPIIDVQIIKKRRCRLNRAAAAANDKSRQWLLTPD